MFNPPTDEPNEACLNYLKDTDSGYDETWLVYIVHGFEGDSVSWLRELRDSIHKR